LRLTQDLYNYLKGHLLNLTFKIMNLEKSEKHISASSSGLEDVSSANRMEAARSTLSFADKIRKGLRIAAIALMPFMSTQTPEVQAKDGVNINQDVTVTTEDIKKPTKIVEQIDNITADETIQELTKGGVLEKQENPNPNGDVKLNVVNVGDIIVMSGERWKVLENDIDKKLLVVRGVSDSNLDTVLNISNKSKDDVIVVSPEGRIPAKQEIDNTGARITRSGIVSENILSEADPIHQNWNGSNLEFHGKIDKDLKNPKAFKRSKLEFIKEEKVYNTLDEMIGDVVREGVSPHAYHASLVGPKSFFWKKEGIVNINSQKDYDTHLAKLNKEYNRNIKSVQLEYVGGGLKLNSDEYVTDLKVPVGVEAMVIKGKGFVILETGQHVIFKVQEKDGRPCDVMKYIFECKNLIIAESPMYYFIVQSDGKIKCIPKDNN